MTDVLSVAPYGGTDDTSPEMRKLKDERDAQWAPVISAVLERHLNWGKR